MRLHSSGTPMGMLSPVMGRIMSQPLSVENRADYVALLKSRSEWKACDLNGLGGAVTLGGERLPEGSALPSIQGVGGLDYLMDGDVVLLLPSGTVNVLYRRASPHNTVLATERCNSLCLMCSQPPKTADDSYRVREILRLLELINEECVELGLSGGEPTLLGDDFFRIVERARDALPKTALHVLTNGRLFRDRSRAARLGQVRHHDLMLGIPLYSDIEELHDYVVQACGAFEDTVVGLHNLAECDVKVEIRVVLHALTYERLPQLAQFIARNVPFASHVALMGLEMFGYVHFNFALLWIDPVEYMSELEKSVEILSLAGMNVSIYNHQLCTMPRSVWPFARRSISDWKNVYLPECEGCAVKECCAGLFQSATKRHSEHIGRIVSVPVGMTEALRPLVGA